MNGLVARWVCLSSCSILIACGGHSTTDGTGNGAQGGSSGSATSGSSNGGSGGADGGTGGIGGSLGGAAGGGGSPCQALIDSYGETLKRAKACNPFIDSNECTGTAHNSIICSCAPTYVNPANAEAIETLNQIEGEAFAQNCLPFGCPAIACEQPVLGTCEPDPSGSSGTCRDLFANDVPGP